MPQTHRLFLALWPDPAVRTLIAKHVRGWGLPPGSAPCPPRDWHLTLHFIGSVPAERLTDIADGTDVPLEPFELVLNRPEVWPGGLAVLGAAEVPQAMQSLHLRLGDSLRGLDLAVDSRPYRPHLTLARHAGDAKPPQASDPVPWPVWNFALVVSTGRPDRRYEVIRRY